AGVSVEQGRLRGDRLDDPWVGVADRRHVVVAVEVAVAVDVPEPHPLAAHELDRLVVEELVAGGERLAATIQQRGFGHGAASAVSGGSRGSAPSESWTRAIIASASRRLQRTSRATTSGRWAAAPGARCGA